MTTALLRWVLLLIFFISLPITYLANQAQVNDAKTILNRVPVLIMNNAGHAVPLYSSHNARGPAVGTLPHRASYRYQYASDSGARLYGILDDREVFIKDPFRTKVIAVANQPLALSWLADAYLIGLTSLFFSITLFVKKRKFIRQQNRRVNGADKTLNNYSRELSQQHRLKTDNHLLKKIIRHQNEQHQTEINKSINSETRLRKYFEDAAKETQTTLAKKETQLATLTRQYERCLKEAKLFDVDFHDKRYKTLLMGRKYEIFFAQQLLKDKSFKILEWTSDKGFVNGISVKANGNPDFVIAYNETRVFAVECKYRSNFFFKARSKEGSERKFIDWANLQQANRYRDFATQRALDVFVAIGFSGEVTEPECNYVVPLNHLRKTSDFEKWRQVSAITGKKETKTAFVIHQKHIYHNYYVLGGLPEKIKKQMSKPTIPA